MNFRTCHSSLAAIVLLVVACGDDESGSNAHRTTDAGPDASSDTSSSSGGKGGRSGANASGGRGGNRAAGSGGKGGAEAGSGGDSQAGSGGATDELVSAGSGGSSGEAAATAGEGGTSPTDAAVSDDDAGVSPTGAPYFTSGNLHGYVWLAQSGAGTTLSTTGYATAEFTPPVCIRGSVAATADSSGNAMLGFSLNQPRDGEPEAFTPTSGGLQVSLTNRGTSPVRVEIQAADGATNDASRWCAIVNGGGGTIAWRDFNTACWDGTGAPYARQPILSATLMIAGTADAAVAYDVCVNQLAEMGDDADAGSF